MRTMHWMLMFAAAALVAACGGGGGDAAPEPLPTDTVPDSANTSANGMGNWLMALAATAPDDREPIDAARFAPPRPDDTEPATLP